MLIVRVELLSAITGKSTELARMTICNDGTSRTLKKGSYDGKALRGRGAPFDYGDFVNAAPIRTARVENYSRTTQHVWNLVAKMLQAMNYK